jgi:CheY-like chemotaxis protein
LFDRSEAFLEAVGEEAPDVAIVDLDHFPLTVVAKLDSAIRTLVVTSSGQRGDAARCHASGAAAYLTRPLDRLDLRDAVRAVLGLHSDALITRHWLRERRSRLKVLAADDNSANRLVLARLLESEGHEVVTVADGREAVAAVQAGQFDIVLMDLDMPGMDGLEATRVLRQSGVEVPVIALTGHLSAERIEACQAAGMTGHLGKPIRLDELIDAVEATMTAALPAPANADGASS